MNDPTPETWLPVVGYEGLYEVSSLGCIRSTPRPRTRGGLLKVSTGKRGYPKVSLCKDDAQVTHEVHRLVAAAFIGPRPGGQEVRHKDGDVLNASSDNLEYGTRSENNLDSVRHGTNSKTRITHCPAGHPYNDANTRWYRNSRYCRTCQSKRSSRRTGNRAAAQIVPDYRRQEWGP